MIGWKCHIAFIDRVTFESPGQYVAQITKELCTSLLLFFASFSIASAQTSTLCRQMLDNAKRLEAHNDLSKAVQAYLNALNCNSALGSEIGPRLKGVFDKIEEQKRREQQAREQAERLSRHFAFNGEEAAWAYKNGLFAVINRNGDNLTGFLYETPEPFKKGVAIAKINDLDQYRYVFLNAKGREISSHFDFLAPVTETTYFAVRSNINVLYEPGNKESAGIELPVRPDGYFLLRQDSLVGLLDSVGKFILPIEYKYISMFSEGLAPVWENDCWSVVNKKGETVIPCEFKAIWSFFEGMAPAIKDDKWGFINHTGQWAIPARFDSAWSFSNGLAQVKTDSLWGFIDKSGKYSIPPQYEACKLFSNGLAAVKKNGKWGYINSKNLIIIDFVFDEAGSFRDGLAIVKTGATSAIINDKGAILTSTNYGVVDNFGWTFITVDTNYLQGIFDQSTQTVLMPAYQFLHAVNDSIFIALKNVEDTEWGVVDRQNNIILPFTYEDILASGTGDYFFVKKNSRYQIVDKRGSPVYYNDPVLVFPDLSYFVRINDWVVFSGPGWHDGVGIVYQYREIYDGLSKFIPFESGGKKGFADRSGRIVFKPDFEEVQPFSRGCAAVRSGEKWGYIDTAGNWIIPPSFKNASPFNEGTAVVKSLDDRIMLIDKSGKNLLPDIQIAGWPFTEGCILAEKENRFGFVDLQGTWIINPEYDNALPFTEGLASATLDGKSGFIDKQGRWIIPPVYEETIAFTGGIAIVSIDTSSGIIDKNGNVLLPIEYQNVMISDNDPNNEKRIVLRNHENKYCRIIICSKHASGEKDAFLLEENGSLKFLKPDEYIESGFSDSRYHYLSDGLLTTQSVEGYRIVNGSLQEILPARYSSIMLVGYRIYLTEQNGRYGLFAPDYNILLPCNYEKIGFVSEENSWIRVQQNSKWGWVDKTGKTMIPCRFDAATPFKNGKARVMQLPYPDEFKINYKGEMLLGQ